MPISGGYIFAESADVGADDATIMWRAAYDPFVLCVDADRVAHSDSGFVLSRLAQFTTVLIDPEDREHIVISNGLRRIRLDVVSGSLVDGPVALRIVCADMCRLKTAATTMAKLASLYQHQRFMPAHFREDRRCARWLATLRVHDGLCAGASQREIAIALYGHKRVASDWYDDNDVMRASVRRLIRTARTLACGQYRSLMTVQRRY